MNFENIMLSGKSQSQKMTYCMISFVLNVQNKKIHRNMHICCSKVIDQGAMDRVSCWVMKYSEIR